MDSYRRRLHGCCVPIAEHTAGRVLSLPMSPTLTPAHVERVCVVLQEVFR